MHKYCSSLECNVIILNQFSKKRLPSSTKPPWLLADNIESAVTSHLASNLAVSVCKTKSKNYFITIHAMCCNHRTSCSNVLLKNLVEGLAWDLPPHPSFSVNNKNQSPWHYFWSSDAKLLLVAMAWAQFDMLSSPELVHTNHILISHLTIQHLFSSYSFHIAAQFIGRT